MWRIPEGGQPSPTVQFGKLRLSRETPHTFTLHLIQCNVNGICNKLHVLCDTLVNPFKPSVLLITESHLTPSVTNATVSIPGYELLRNDSGNSSKHGVCAFVEENLKFDNVDVSHPNCLSFRLRCLNVYVFVVYRPPSNTPEENQALIDFLLKSCTGRELIILGDFNLPSIVWRNQQPGGAISVADGQFADMFRSLGLTQWISEGTFPRSENMLDLILTSEEDRISAAHVQPPPPGCDHCSTHCDYVFDMDIQIASQQHNRLQWHRGRYGTINNILSDIDWDLELSNLSAQDAFIKLLSILEPLVDQYIPRVSQGARRRKVPWKSNPPSSLKRRRKAVWDKYKGLRSNLGRKAPLTVSALKTFQEVNNQLRTFASRSQIEYEKSLIERSKENPKLLHSYMRHKKQLRCSVGPLRLASGAVSDDPGEMADCFLDAF